MSERRCDTVSLRVSAILDKHRRAQDLTIKALAEKADISPTHTGYALDGRTIRTSTLAKIAEALDCDLVLALRPRPKPVTVQVRTRAEYASY